MTTRVHILLDEADKARYRRQAQREGKSLGAWLRAAAEERLRLAEDRRELRSSDDLARFFSECDQREQQREPDWAEHRRVIEQSRSAELDVT